LSKKRIKNSGKEKKDNNSTLRDPERESKEQKGRWIAGMFHTLGAVSARKKKASQKGRCRGAHAQGNSEARYEKVNRGKVEGGERCRGKGNKYEGAGSPRGP